MSVKKNVTRSVLNTPDFFFAREQDAFGKIGVHLLVIALYEGGVVVGHKFDKRQNMPQQWLKRINSEMLLCGWGDLGDFQEIAEFVWRDSLFLRDILTEDYVTIAGLWKNLRRFLKDCYAGSAPYEVDCALVGAREKEIWMVDFRGNVKPLTGFCVLGGYSYSLNKPAALDKEMLAKILMGGGVEGAKMPAGDHKYPAKEAVSALDEIYKGRPALGSIDEALDAVRLTLFKCDPPSKKETFELTAVENEESKSMHVKREKPKEAENKPDEKPRT